MGNSNKVSIVGLSSSVHCLVLVLLLQEELSCTF